MVLPQGGIARKSLLCLLKVTGKPQEFVHIGTACCLEVHFLVEHGNEILQGFWLKQC
ncbi:MAG: hypothetical protein ACSI46_14320 [Gloeotrichia echinulata DVL01]|jgi:hypothetical protein